MKFHLSLKNSQDCECIILGILENQKLCQVGQEFDSKFNNQISKFLAQGDFQAKFAETFLLTNLEEAKRVLLVGVGDVTKINVAKIQTIYGKIAQALQSTAIKNVACYLNFDEIIATEQHLQVASCAISDALYQFNEFRSKAVEKAKLENFSFIVENEKSQTAVLNAKAISNGINFAKNLANSPANVATPEFIAQQAKKFANNPKIKVEFLRKKELAELQMNAYLAVAGASINEPVCTIVHYNNAPSSEAPIVLVGKGVTFDAGGISIKPADSMHEMKYDMCGAASVLGVMQAVAELDLPINLIAVAGCCENLLDGNSYRPGDILKTMSGKTVEVLNTDAEGRLVLCDLLTYVERFEPKLVIDVATLTGACMVALGSLHSGLMSNNQDLADELLQAGKYTGDLAWQLPIGEGYQAQLKSNFADLGNIGGRLAGACTAGQFLANFTEKYTWAHLDIAGSAWVFGGTKGATGRSIALLTQFLIDKTKA